VTTGHLILYTPLGCHSIAMSCRCNVIHKRVQWHRFAGDMRFDQRQHQTDASADHTPHIYCAFSQACSVKVGPVGT
jgi:hypothetical protein